jgi:hypothetical protein
MKTARMRTKPRMLDSLGITLFKCGRRPVFITSNVLIEASL